ncbi:MAG TPA: phage holin family protein [Streptosporangiaceae bacterium]|nr:phage holin family protein [Streptosporangiaceae bacterium]
MAEPAARQPAGSADDQSLGGLVSLAVRDMTQLIRCELDLAKMELKDDARRLGISGALIGMAAFVGCLVLMLLCFAFAFGLVAAGIWVWAAFLIVAGTCVLLAALALLIAYMKVRRLTGLRQTRQTVQDDLALIRRDDSAALAPSGGAG